MAKKPQDNHTEDKSETQPDKPVPAPSPSAADALGAVGAEDEGIAGADQGEAKKRRGLFWFLSLCLRIITAPLWLPFWLIIKAASWVYRRLLGPRQFRFGPIPVDHSEPDFSQQEPTLIKGQMVFLLILIFSSVAIIWAYHAELDEQVRADGSVIPPSDVQIIQARLPGLVTEIGIELGSEVSVGDVLFRMEDEDVVANFADNEVIIISSEVALVRLKAEAELQTALVFPEALTGNDKAAEAIADETNLFWQRRDALEKEQAVLAQQIETLRRTIEERETEQRQALRQAELQEGALALIDDEEARYRPLVEAGHEPLQTLHDIKRRQQDAKIQLQDIFHRAERAEKSAATLASELRAKAEEQSALTSKFQEAARAQLVEVQTRLAGARARQDALAGKVRYAEIRAQHDGVISALHLKTEGAVVQQGSVLAELVPNNSEVTIRARLLPQDVADVTIGQQARISLLAYDVSRFGNLTGYVTHIASNTTEQEGQLPFYETLIEIPDPVFEQSGLTPEFVPGMQVVVDILGGKRTVLEYLLTPIRRASDVAFREK